MSEGNEGLTEPKDRDPAFHVERSQWGLSVVDQDGEELFLMPWEQVRSEHAEVVRERENEVGVKYPKNFAPFMDDEPVFRLRAKDNLATATVFSYLELLENAGLAPDGSPFLESILEWLERAAAWRNAHPDLCKDPTF